MKLTSFVTPLRGCARLRALALLVAVGCGASSDDGVSPTVIGIRIVSGANVSDTVSALLPLPLIVQARPNGKPRAGVVVHFEMLPASEPGRENEATILVARAPPRPFDAFGDYGPFALITTDSTGTASASVQLGQVAGPVRLLITCPELGLADTARFTVLPGAASRLVVTPRDSLVSTGGILNLDAQVVDRYGNRRADPVTFASGSALATVSSVGAIAAGQSVGRAAVAVRSGSIVDSVRFTVVPDVTIAFVATGTGNARSIATSKLDGSHFVRITSPSAPASPGFPATSPATSTIAYTGSQTAAATIYLVDGPGPGYPVLTGLGMQYAANPRISADGRFVYFAGQTTIDDPPAIWRIRMDGTGLQRISTTRIFSVGGSQPAPSPDGTRVAFQDSTGLIVLTLATGAMTKIAEPGAATLPVYSPDGLHIAYIAGEGIVVRNADGSSPTNLAPGLVLSDAALSWLPDGRWLLSSSIGGPFLVNVATGDALVLSALRSSYSQMSVWR